MGVAATIEVMPGSFGAYVDGVVSTLADPEAVQLVQAALVAHHVVVVRSVAPTRAEYATFGRHFGEPIEFFDKRSRNIELPELIEIHNAPSTPAAMRDGAMHWHQDSTYEAVPAGVTMLLAEEAPDVGNETLFANLIAAYDALDTATKTRIEDLVVRHDPQGGKVALPGERRGGERRSDRVVPEVHHPLVVHHPTTGERALYGISGTAAGIVGLDDDEAIGLLMALKQHALRPEFRQQATAATGSILIWDNFAVMHCATPTLYSDEPGRRRTLFRISTRASVCGMIGTPRFGARL